MRRLALIMLAGGCSFSTSLSSDGSTGGEQQMIDAAIDAPPDVFDDKCFGSGAFYFCLSAVPTGMETLDDADEPIDTTTCTGSNQQLAEIPGTPPTSVCVIAADTIELPGQAGTDIVDVIGMRPLVLVGVTSITISGSLDASSYVTSVTKVGPNANAAQCTTAGIDGASNGGRGGGGAGGTYGTVGGNGGTGNGGGAAAGMAAAPPASFDVVRGGCRGGNGAAGNAGTGGAAGAGGGALFLVSRGTITVDGVIDASGAGADGGRTSFGGGGGGGAGGMIVFDAVTLSVDGNARIYANGGGGGGGAGNSGAGEAGADPLPPDITMPANGGDTTNGGASVAGDGAAGATNATAGANSANGGAGGGGGHGVIRVLRGTGAFPAGTVSPTPTP